MICRKCRQEAPAGPYCALCGARQDTAPKRPKKRGNGTGTVYKRGSVWTAERTLYYTLDDNGKKRRKAQTKSGFRTKRDALDWLAKLSETESRSAPTLLDLWNTYEQTELGKLSASKQSAYKIARARLEPIIHRKIDTLTTIDLQQTVSKNATSYYTARDMKVLLSHMYKRACADQFVQANLSEYIVLPTLEEKESTPFNENEVAKIWAAWQSGDTFAGYLLVMIYSGMMPGELLSILKANIDYDKNEIYRSGKKTAIRKEKPISFAGCVADVLRKLADLTDGDKLVQRNRDAWYSDYHEFCKRIGIRDLPPYACRHTTGTEAAKLGLNAPTIQAIMRHAKITTSQRYIHMGSKEAHAGLDRMPTSKKATKNPADSGALSADDG